MLHSEPPSPAEEQQQPETGWPHQRKSAQRGLSRGATAAPGGPGRGLRLRCRGSCWCRQFARVRRPGLDRRLREPHRRVAQQDPASAHVGVPHLALGVQDRLSQGAAFANEASQPSPRLVPLLSPLPGWFFSLVLLQPSQVGSSAPFSLPPSASGSPSVRLWFLSRVDEACVVVCALSPKRPWWFLFCPLFSALSQVVLAQPVPRPSEKKECLYREKYYLDAST
jgi:hypothetical protein